MNTLHENNYDIGRAVLSLITASGPVLCRDELEEWSAAEANLFEDALEKYGKEFTEIRKDYVCFILLVALSNVGLFLFTQTNRISVLPSCRGSQ